MWFKVVSMGPSEPVPNLMGRTSLMLSETFASAAIHFQGGPYLGRTCNGSASTLKFLWQWTKLKRDLTLNFELADDGAIW